MDTSAILLSLRVAGIATGLVLLTGLPLAWLLARGRFRGRSLMETLVLLPLVLPPSVMGYGLLRLLGGQGPVGAALASWGFAVAFTWRGAVVAAWLAALGLFVRTAQTGLEQVDARLEAAARTLGRSGWSIFWSLTLPLAWRSVLAGAVLAFCRAAGEFGITLMVGGNIPGVTRTVPLLIYQQVQSNHFAPAGALALGTAVVVTVLLAGVHHLTRRQS
jgi:molybdate transport system permease protein